jgi:hypothetical protein
MSGLEYVRFRFDSEEEEDLIEEESEAQKIWDKYKQEFWRYHNKSRGYGVGNLEVRKKMVADEGFVENSDMIVVMSETSNSPEWMKANFRLAHKKAKEIQSAATAAHLPTFGLF